MRSSRRARVLLPGQPLGGGRYVVARTLGFSGGGGRYLVRRTDDGSHWRMDVVEPPADLAEDEERSRIERFTEALERLRGWSHPGLVRVHEHFSDGSRQFVITAGLEGHNLEAAVKWRTEPPTREQVLDWGLTLGRLLQFLQEGGLLALARDLAPSGVVVTPDGRLVLRDLDFGALLAEAGPGGAFLVLQAAMQRFAGLLAFTATGAMPGEPEADRIDPDLAWVIGRCRSTDASRTYRGFPDLLEALENLRAPEEAPQAAPVADKPASAVAPLELPPTPAQALVRALARQPAWLKALEVLLLALAALALPGLFRPPLPARTGPALYLSAGQDLFAVDPATMHVQGRLDLGQPLGPVAASLDGRRLFVAESEGQAITVVDTVSQEVVGHVKVDRRPESMRLDPSGRRLYVLHPSTARLLVVDLEASGPGSSAGARTVGMVATGADPLAFALLPADPEAGLPARAAVACGDGSVTLYGLDPPTAMATRSLGRMSSLVSSRDGRTLFALSPDLGKVVALDGATLTPLGSLADTGGGQPFQGVLSRDGQELWVLNRSGSLGVVDTGDLTLRSSVKLGGNPRFSVLGPPEGPPTLWVALGSSGEVARVEPGSRDLQGTARVASHLAGGAAVGAPPEPTEP